MTDDSLVVRVEKDPKWSYNPNQEELYSWRERLEEVLHEAGIIEGEYVFYARRKARRITRPNVIMVDWYQRGPLVLRAMDKNHSTVVYTAVAVPDQNLLGQRLTLLASTLKARRIASGVDAAASVAADQSRRERRVVRLKERISSATRVAREAIAKRRALRIELREAEKAVEALKSDAQQ